MASTSSCSSLTKAGEFPPSTSVGSTLSVKEPQYDVYISNAQHPLGTAIYEKLDALGLKVFPQALALRDQQLEAAIKSASFYLAIFSEDYAHSSRCLEEISIMCTREKGIKIFPIFYHVKHDDVRYAKGVYAEAFQQYEKMGQHYSEKLPRWRRALHSVSHNIGFIVNSKEDEDTLLKNIADHVAKRDKKISLMVEEIASANTSSRNHQQVEEFAQSASNSSASTMLDENRPYDVFINHRGPDVKHTLAIAIYRVLKGMGLKVFLDSEELAIGDHFPSVLEKVMKSAKLHIAILSENYAQSRWCLRELAFMLQTGTKIVPCFYNVKPEDVRDPEGDYARAISHKEAKTALRNGRMEKCAQMSQEWKSALQSVSHNTGHILLNKDEDLILKSVVNSVAKEFRKLQFMATEHLVGLDETLEDFENVAIPQDHHSVKVFVIWGMGGAGKTTLAKRFYNKMCTSMNKCSFILDVRDAASKNLLVNKQKQLLENLGFGDVAVDSIEECKAILASRLKYVNVFIVLDDVDHVDQLDALMPNKDSLGPASLIVITTRDLGILRCWDNWSKYKMRGLPPFHSRQLFCWHAFLQPCPRDGFEELVDKFVEMCMGLPLSLKIFGGQLYGSSSKDYWTTQLHKLSRTLPNDFKKLLKTSYDALNNEEKEAFLDAACFFIGEESNLAIEIWNGSGWDGMYSLEMLVNKCLIEIDEKNCIKMHNHLRDMGRDIAIRQSPHRIWHHRQIIEMHSELIKLGIRGFMTAKAVHSDEVAEIEDGDWEIEQGKLTFQTNGGSRALASSSFGLKIMVTRGPNLYEVIKSSKDLLWLRWFDCGQRNLQSLTSLKYLRVLELYEKWGNQHLRELWADECDPPLLLRKLVISECHALQRFPKSVQHLKHLKTIILSSRKLESLPGELCLVQSLEHLDLCGCCELSSLPESMGSLTNLRHLDLCGCYELSSLPESMGSLTNLWHLDLSQCRKLKRLPNSFKDLTLLQHLDAQDCSNVTFQLEMMENMSKLEYLNFSNCEQVEELPCDILNQRSLRGLYLKGMKTLRGVPMKIGQLSKLQILDIGSDRLSILPDSLGDLSSLTELSIIRCPMLECLPDSMGRLNLLERLTIVASGVKSIPLPVSQLSNLKTLEILASPIRKLDLVSSSLGNLNRLHLQGTQLYKISISGDRCPSLETLIVKDNDRLMEIEVLPGTIRDGRAVVGLLNLQRLEIIHCHKLYALPNFAQLPSLREIELRSCYQARKVQGLEHCTGLKVLKAYTWLEVPDIPSLERMERLSTLHLQAMRKPVVEGCIQSTQKLPGETIVCMRAVQNAASLVSSLASLVNPSTFPSLCVVDSCSNLKIDKSHSAKLVKKKLTNGNGTIVCFVINCFTSRMSLTVEKEGWDDAISETEVEEGKWVWIGIFTEWQASKRYKLGVLNESEGKGEVERGVMVMGEDPAVLQNFCRLWG